MPTSKRKGIPGKCSLPKDYLHHPTHSMSFMGGLGHGAMGMPFMGLPQHVSLGQLSVAFISWLTWKRESMCELCWIARDLIGISHDLT
jgi:hypothetical protein